MAPATAESPEAPKMAPAVLSGRLDAALDDLIARFAACTPLFDRVYCAQRRLV